MRLAVVAAIVAGSTLSAVPALAAHPVALIWDAAPAAGGGYDYDFRLVGTNGCAVHNLNWIIVGDHGSLAPAGAQTLVNPSLLGPAPAPFTALTGSTGGHGGPTFLNSADLSNGFKVTAAGTQTTWRMHADNLVDPAHFYWSALIGEALPKHERAIRGPCTGGDSDGDGVVDACDADDDNDCTLDGDDCAPLDATRRPGATETCNGLDDDCDGAADDGFDVGAACSVGVGACARSGAKICAADGLSTVCGAVPGTPGPETCNGLDDDCDGTPDDGFDVGATCSVGVGACAASGVKICAADGASTVCGATPGTPGVELCGNGVDDDCDGATDEGFDVGAACTAGVGACAASGAKVCAEDRLSTVCDAVPGAPGTELCNGVDDDCDGTPDDGFDVGAACSVGVGACARSGTKLCAASGLSAECDAVAGAPGTEVCNGVDDDCNGAVDDGGDALCAAATDGTRCVSASSIAYCGCVVDADCGGKTSGRVCDPSTKRCIDGCSGGTDRNGCPTGLFCTSADPAVVGTCTTTCNFDADCAATVPDKPYCLKPGSGEDAGVDATSDALTDAGEDAGEDSDDADDAAGTDAATPSDGGLSTCVACVTDAHCAGRADGRTKCLGNVCAQCSATDTSACTTPAGSACVSGVCGCTSDDDCAGGRVCDLAASTCVESPDAGPGDAGDAGADATGDGAVDGDAGPAGAIEDPAGGCGCEIPARSGRSGALAMLGSLVALATLARRRTR